MKNFGYFCLPFLLSIAAGCTRFDASSQFFDTHVHAEFIMRIDAAGIRYRVAENSKVEYSNNDQQTVRAISDAINAKYYPGCGVTLADAVEMQKVSARLDMRHVAHSMVELDAGPTITCAAADHEKLMDVLRECGVIRDSQMSFDRIPS